MGTADILTTRVQRREELEPHRTAWRTLAAEAPMRSPEWLLTWWDHYAGPGDELCVLLFHHPDGVLVGLAPLYLEVRGSKRTFRLLGSEAWTNHTTWLAAAGYQQAVSLAVARFLLESRPSWNCLRLDAADADDPALNDTVSLLAQRGFLVHRTPLHSVWKIALPESWDAYLMMLSKTHRKRCRKLQSDYLDSGVIQVRRVTGQAEFERGFQVLLELHGARWGEAKKPLGCFSDPRYRAFHEAVARQLLDRNQLMLTWLEYGGRPVAAEYQLMSGDTVYSYQAGMDPTVTGFPAGNLSLIASIRFAIEHGCRWFDLSSGDQPYKGNFRATPSACHDIRLWPAGLSGRLRRSVYSVRGGLEGKRLQTVRWVKAKLPPSLIEKWRDLVVACGGSRLRPRKVQTPP